MNRVLFIATLMALTLGHRVQDSLLVDSDGRKRVYHGVNVVYKLAPFYPPINDHFDPVESLSDEDFSNLRSWGMTVIRLHVAWEGTEPTKGVYNYDYLDQLKQIVRKAAQYDIQIILDAHQDLLSRFFCGEGMPDWAVSRSPYSFPFPLKQKFDLDEKGYPLIEQCTKTKFALFYFAFDITQTFQALFENTDGVADSFASFWGEVAKYFKDEPNVLGYEILNEPISGNVYHNLLEFLWPHKGNNKNLLPLYQRVNNQIRKHDQEKIIFFEPGISDQLGAGFADTPGGISYRDREVYSYHLYCPLVDNFGIPTNDIGCKVFDKIFFGMREKVAKQLSVGKFLTEFGAMTDHPTGNKELTFILSLTESSFTSWAYWQFKYFQDITTMAHPGNIESFYDPEGNMSAAKVKTLARPYATAICGTPVHTSFNPSSNHFFQLNWNASNNCNGKRTQVFLSEQFYYLKKKQVQFKNCNLCQLVQVSPSYYEVQLPADFKEGSQVILYVLEW